MFRVNHLSTLFSALFAVILSVSPLLAQNAPVSPADKLPKLEQRLEDIDHDLRILNTELIALTAGFQKYQRDIVYTNGPAAVLYKEIKEIEKGLVEKRKQLQAETAKAPGSVRFIEGRKIIVKKQKGLRDLQVLVTNEIKALRLRAAADSKKNIESD